MSIAVETERLQYELAIRAMTRSSLARKAGVSKATVSSTFAGNPISETTLGLIAEALTATPVNPTIESLLAPPGGASGDGPAPTPRGQG
jgi:transcriptional regulator with XRE-family HTH domain